MLVENDIEKGTCMFKLTNLHAAYEQFDSRNVILLFPEGMPEILQNACLLSEYNSEALQFSKVAKINRNEMSQTENEYKFDGFFPKYLSGRLSVIQP